LARVRRIIRAIAAIVGIGMVIVVLVNVQGSLVLPYGLGPYGATAILTIAYSMVDRLLDYLAGKENVPKTILERSEVE